MYAPERSLPGGLVARLLGPDNKKVEELSLMLWEAKLSWKVSFIGRSVGHNPGL